LAEKKREELKYDLSNKADLALIAAAVKAGW
jgi:hypothetical protein